MPVLVSNYRKHRPAGEVRCRRRRWTPKSSASAFRGARAKQKSSRASMPARACRDIPRCLDRSSAWKLVETRWHPQSPGELPLLAEIDWFSIIAMAARSSSSPTLRLCPLVQQLAAQGACRQSPRVEFPDIPGRFMSETSGGRLTATLSATAFALVGTGDDVSPQPLRHFRVIPGRRTAGSTR